MTEKCADSSRFSSNPGEALREIQNVKSAATVGDLSLQLSKCWIKHCHEKIEARENKNTAMWKERLSNMNGEARLSWNLTTFEVQYPTSCESIRWLAGASLETTVPSASFSIQIGFGAASGGENFAWFCMLELPLADLAQDGQGVEMEELQLAHAAELQRLQTQHQVATVYWNETGLWSGSKSNCSQGNDPTMFSICRFFFFTSSTTKFLHFVVCFRNHSVEG